ncbi:MAG: peptidoglycan recognition family protein [Phycisphaerales bacterium]
MSRKARSARRNPPPVVSAEPPIRTRIVWGALAGSMTLVGGTLWALQGSPMPRLDGLSLPPLVAAAGPSTVEGALATRVPLDRVRWTSIVIHHTGTSHATPASLEAQARAMNLEGLGYHFIVGNGSGLGEGAVHVGYRWLDQLPGAHVAGPLGDEFNRASIGICLVGDGRRRPFSDDQIERLAQLAGELCERLGITADRVFLHSDLARTDDPGRFFPTAAFRERLGAR